MAQEDITVPRWFLENIENTLCIQNNINLDKRTGETCQDRNVKAALNGVRKLLKGEELTGMERLEKLINYHSEDEKPKGKYGERFVKVKVVIKTWTEVEDVIEYDTRYEQFIIPSNYQLDCKVIRWSYFND